MQKTAKRAIAARGPTWHAGSHEDVGVYHTRKKLLPTCEHQLWTLKKSIELWRMEESGREGEKEED